MTTSPMPTAADELVRRSPGVNPEVLAAARQAADFLRGLGLLSTSPTEVTRPFTRRPDAPPRQPPVSIWANPNEIRLAQV